MLDLCIEFCNAFFSRQGQHQSKEIVTVQIRGHLREKLIPESLIPILRSLTVQMSVLDLTFERGPKFNATCVNTLNRNSYLLNIQISTLYEKRKTNTTNTQKQNHKQNTTVIWGWLRSPVGWVSEVLELNTY